MLGSKEHERGFIVVDPFDYQVGCPKRRSSEELGKVALLRQRTRFRNAAWLLLYHLKIGFREIVALEQQRLTCDLRKRIGKAIAEI
jgi:hypothetical protein